MRNREICKTVAKKRIRNTSESAIWFCFLFCSILLFFLTLRDNQPTSLIVGFWFLRFHRSYKFYLACLGAFLSRRFFLRKWHVLLKKCALPTFHVRWWEGAAQRHHVWSPWRIRRGRRAPRRNSSVGYSHGFLSKPLRHATEVGVTARRIQGCKEKKKAYFRFILHRFPHIHLRPVCNYCTLKRRIKNII